LTIRDALRVQAEAQDVDRRLEQVRCRAGDQHPDARVRRDHAPMAVDDDRGIRLVAGQHPIERDADRLELGLVQPALPVRRRVARREQQLVAVAQRHVEPVGEVEDHVRARPRPPGLDEAQVPGGHVRLERQVELAHAPAPAPLLQERPDAGAGDRVGHEEHASAAAR